MESGLEFSDFYDFLSVELNVSRSEVNSMMRSSTKHEILNNLKKTSPKLFSMDISLVTDVKDHNGNILLNKDADFINYLPSLIEWRMKNNDANLDTFALKPTSLVIGYYKEKVMNNVYHLLDRLTRQRLNPFSHIFEKLEDDESLQKIKANFLGIIEDVMRSPAGLSNMVRIAGRPNGSNSMLESSVNSAFICMAVMQIMTQFDSGQKGKIQDVGLAAIFQNISIMDGFYTDIEIRGHAERSAAIADQMNLPEEVVDAILLHHHYEDGGGILPVFADKDVEMSDILRVLISVNLFIDSVITQNSNPTEFEIYKIMWLVARNGYIDPLVVKILRELFLDPEKDALLSSLFMIASKCPNALIWHIKGDTPPTKFICQKNHCKHISRTMTIIPQDVNIYHNDRIIGKVGKGTYYSCNMLEELKRKVMKVISQRRDH